MRSKEGRSWPDPNLVILTIGVFLSGGAGLINQVSRIESFANQKGEHQEEILSFLMRIGHERWGRVFPAESASDGWV